MSTADLAGLTGASDTAPVTKLAGAGGKAVDGKDSGFSDALTSLAKAVARLRNLKRTRPVQRVKRRFRRTCPPQRRESI